MPVDILLPILGESISSAVLVRWRKKAGETVKLGDIVAEIETEKASMELESPAGGLLYKVFVDEGITVTTGQQLAIVLAPGEKPGDQSPPPVAAPQPGTPSLPGKGMVRPEVQFEAEASRRVSPAARKMAQELGVDIALVSPATLGARVTTEDVQRYLADGVPAQHKAAALPSHLVTLNEVRRTVARRMTESAQTIPQFSITTEVEMDTFHETLQAVQPPAGGVPGKISVTALLTYLVAKALSEHPMVNARYDMQGIMVFDTINIAVAVSTERGLVAPVIHQVEILSLADLAGRLGDLIRRSKEGHLMPEDLAGGTFTVSNLGMYGVTQFIPLVNPPQAAILGVGAILPGPNAASNSRKRQTSRMNLSLSADHRVLDGSEVAAFLATLKEIIEKYTPEEIKT